MTTLIELIGGIAMVYVAAELWIAGMLWIAKTLTDNGIRWSAQPEHHW